MQFTPKTDKELIEMNLWQPGDYSFEVVDQATIGQNTWVTEERQSSKGNEMIQLVLRVYSDTGGFITMRDFLMESMPAKLKHAAQTMGLEDKYNEGCLKASDFIGRSGVVELKIERDKTGQYADKNAVKDYIVKANQTPHYKAKANGYAPEPEPLDDEMPF